MSIEICLSCFNNVMNTNSSLIMFIFGIFVLLFSIYMFWIYLKIENENFPTILMLYVFIIGLFLINQYLKIVVFI